MAHIGRNMSSSLINRIQNRCVLTYPTPLLNPPIVNESAWTLTCSDRFHLCHVFVTSLAWSHSGRVGELYQPPCRNTKHVLHSNISIIITILHYNKNNHFKLLKLEIRPPSLILLITISQDRWIFHSQTREVRNSMIMMMMMIIIIIIMPY